MSRATTIRPHSGVRPGFRTGLIVLSALAATALTSAVAPEPAGAAQSAGYTVRSLHFAVRVGPHRSQHCDIVGDLYAPRSATPRHRVPAILTTNGFGGSKDDQAGIGKAFADRGYVVLSYSGLGFGGSGCKITLDDPDFDGAAASQLVSYLGGAGSIAYTDAKHTTPAATLRIVRHDARDHAGHARRYDPRVGMVGGSYGGGVQFAAAAVDPRVDTLVPLITWNDLSYSLAPNNTDQVRGVSTANPGAIKLTWGLLFSADGALDGVQGAAQDPTRLFGCPNFALFVCPALVTGGSTGFFQPDAVAALRHASVASFMKRIKVPVLLVQGENDTLFNLNEAAATYRALRAEHTPVTMIWQSWGHSDSTPAPGEIDLDAPNPASQYETRRVVAWFDHYLRGHSRTSTGPRFAYFRDWVHYTGIATPAYGHATAFPLPGATTLQLSGDGTLVPSAARPGVQRFVTPPAGAPTSVDPLDVIGSFSSSVPDGTERDAPGTAASWTSAALGRPLTVVGSPVLHVRLTAPTAAATQRSGPVGQLVLFAKLLDVAPGGTAALIHGLVAPVRVADVGAPVRITLPGIVHRFAAGHRLRLVVSGGAGNYRGGLTPTPVSIAGGAAQTLRLPTTG
jgi:predicted acyl esterase